MNEKLIIRPYTPEDWEPVQEIHDAARKIELRLADLDAAFLPMSVAAEREDLFDCQLRVAELEGKAVGFIAFSEDELAWLYVSPDFHRQGIGRALMAAALREMPTIRRTEVLVGNTPARTLYERFGFRVVQTLRGVMTGNESFPAAGWIMEIA